MLIKILSQFTIKQITFFKYIFSAFYFINRAITNNAAILFYVLQSNVFDILDCFAIARNAFRNDVITAFNGTDITSMSELQTLLAKCSPGDTVSVSIAQAANNYAITTVQVTLGTQQ